MKLHFDVKFKGEVKNLDTDIPFLIEDKARKTDGRDYQALFVDDFLVDVKSKTKPKPPSTIEVPQGLSLHSIYLLTVVVWFPSY